MKYSKSKLNTLTFLIVGASLCGAHADGYRNPAPTAEGIAKSGANMIFVDDASAISYNPANLALQTNASAVVAVAFARAENTYTHPQAGEVVSDDPWAVLPNLYYSMPAAEGIVWGLGITTPYGQGVSWDPASLAPFPPAPLPPAGTAILYDAEMVVINFNPTVAVKLGDSVSLAAGLDVYYSQLGFKGLVATGAPNPAPPYVDVDADGDGWGIGGNAALTWMVTDNQRLALTYRSQVDLEYEGDLTMDISFPNIFGAGYGIQLTDDIQVEALIEWIEWSVNDVQTATVTGLGTFELVNNWEDTITAAIGGSWQFAEGWVVRAGYSFIESPIPDSSITPILPDTDRNIFGLGLGYTFGGHTVDLSYSHTVYADRSSTNPVYPGTYDIASNLIGMTYSVSF
ncbi:outer membrane protein transport protein [Pontiellaceae bacterium B1224]|nr:outer membrane protein transport protein [Pontiellaceae bacterium B1224]